MPSSGSKALQGVAEDPACRPVGGNPTMTGSRQRAREGGSRRTGSMARPSSRSHGPGRDGQTGTGRKHRSFPRARGPRPCALWSRSILTGIVIGSPAAPLKRAAVSVGVLCRMPPAGQASADDACRERGPSDGSAPSTRDGRVGTRLRRQRATGQTRRPIHLRADRSRQAGPSVGVGSEAERLLGAGLAVGRKAHRAAMVGADLAVEEALPAHVSGIGGMEAGEMALD